MATKKRMIELLNKHFPSLRACEGENFDDNYSRAIWLRGINDLDTNKSLLISEYYDNYLRADLHDLITKSGWYFGFYDNYTVFLHRY